jgi:integrase
MKLWRINGIFHYRFQVGGVRVQKSTGTSVQGQANKIATDAYKDAEARAQGREPIPTQGDLRTRWLTAHVAPAVSLGHWRNVNDWDAHGMDDVKLDRLSTELVTLAREAHRQGRVDRVVPGKPAPDPTKPLKPRTKATVDGWMRNLNLLIGWAIQCKLISAKPYEIKMPKPQKVPKKILPLAKVKPWLEAIKAAARNPLVFTASALMAGLGLRESEALGSRWEWLNWEDHTYIPGRLVDGEFTTKGKEAKPIDVPDWLYQHLLDLRGADPRMGLILPWPQKDGLEIPHPKNFTRRAMAAACKVLGTSGVTAHRTRGTWITHLLRQGTPLKDVQSMARHKSKATTLDYYEESDEVKKEAQKKLAKGMGF